MALAIHVAISPDGICSYFETRSQELVIGHSKRSRIFPYAENAKPSAGSGLAFPAAYSPSILTGGRLRPGDKSRDFEALPGITPRRENLAPRKSRLARGPLHGHTDDRDHLFRSIATSVARVLTAPLDGGGDVSLLMAGQAR